MEIESHPTGERFSSTKLLIHSPPLHRPCRQSEAHFVIICALIEAIYAIYGMFPQLTSWIQLISRVIHRSQTVYYWITSLL